MRAGWASEREYMGRVARAINEPRWMFARERPGPVLGLTPAVRLLLERVRVCGCLCGVSMIASLCPACLTSSLSPFFRQPSSLQSASTFKVLVVLAFLRLIPVAEVLDALFLQLLELAW